ncbi:MAG TPA: hypothetical protein VFX92_07510 [Candidatus Krumholzibacteria bacterium]|nr:hypothetical protein [Candidatus Krumholzibacteria bacterium]
MSNGGIAGAVAGAAVARRRRQILTAFRNAGATAPDRAVAETALDIRGDLLYRSMEKRGIIKKTAGGKVYLDERAEEEAQRVRRLIVAALLLLAGIGIAWAFAMRGSGSHP